jgi:hypothetical protein
VINWWGLPVLNVLGQARIDPCEISWYVLL